MKQQPFNAKENYITNDNGKVLYYLGTRRYYPYRWDYQYQCWNECSGVYTYQGIRRLECMGKVRFFG